MPKRAIILSGGLGTRLKPFTDAVPKPLLPIGEKAVLEIQIERLAKFGFNEIILATNYKSQYIENFFGNGSRYGINLSISKENEPLGTAGPLKLLEDRLDEPFLVMNGDILCLADLNIMYEFALRNSSELTVGIKKILLPFAFGNILFEGDRVIKVEEKPDIITYALAGIYVMKPPILKNIPSGCHYGMDKLIHSALERNELVAKYEINDYWLDIGNVDDYEKAQKEFEYHSNEVAE